jgi:hypothetical protein
MPKTGAAPGVALNALSAVITTLGFAVAFAIYELLAVAREDVTEVIVLGAALVAAAIFGACVGRRRQISTHRVTQGYWPYVWGGGFGLVAAALGIASAQLSVWCLVVLSFVAAVLLGIAGNRSRTEERHG